VGVDSSVLGRVKIFNIGKANAEIEKLQGDFTKAQEEISTLKENASALEKAAETEKSRADKAETEAKQSAEKVSALEKENSYLKAEAEKAKADKEAHCKDFDSKVEKAAGEKSAAIMASMGVPPVPTGTTSNVKLDFSALVAAQVAKGMSKAKAVESCIKSNPAEYSEWRASGKTQTL
jgi:uncharacterized phage infection (PIP) family protein YhgE